MYEAFLITHVNGDGSTKMATRRGLGTGAAATSAGGGAGSAATGASAGSPSWETAVGTLRARFGLAGNSTGLALSSIWGVAASLFSPADSAAAA